MPASMPLQWKPTENSPGHRHSGPESYRGGCRQWLLLWQGQGHSDGCRCVPHLHGKNGQKRVFAVPAGSQGRCGYCKKGVSSFLQQADRHRLTGRAVADRIVNKNGNKLFELYIVSNQAHGIVQTGLQPDTMLKGHCLKGSTSPSTRWLRSISAITGETASVRARSRSWAMRPAIRAFSYRMLASQGSSSSSGKAVRYWLRSLPPAF